MKKHIVSVLAGLLIVSSLVAQVDSLSVSKTKYESARTKIESDAMASYSNSLVAVMATLKQKGDLDTFLAVQKELERLGIKKTLGNTNSTVSVINLNAAKYTSDVNQKLQNLIKQYIVYLEGLIKQAMVTNKIDEAKEIKIEIDRVKFEHADLESKLPKVEQSKAEAKQAEAKKIPSMAGKWDYAGDCNIAITQSGNEWKGDAVNSKHTRFHVSGTITESGIITGKLEWVKAPPGKTDRDLRCQLSPDGKVISGIQNGKDYPNAKLLWTRIK